jgi:PhnB protein
MKIEPHVQFNGQCDEAFALYQKTLGGTIVARHTFAGSPMEGQIGKEWGNKVMHISMRFGEQLLLGSDAPPPHYNKPQGLQICLEFDDVAEAERVFRALSEGGQIGMAFQETFWAKGFAMFHDRFGTPWMINVSKPM